MTTLPKNLKERLESPLHAAARERIQANREERLTKGAPADEPELELEPTPEAE